MEKRITAQFDVELEKSYEEAIKKAQFLIKLAIPKAFLEARQKENMQKLKAGLASRLLSSALGKAGGVGGFKGLGKQSTVAAIGGGSASLAASQSTVAGLTRRNSLKSRDGSEMLIKSDTGIDRKKTLLVRGSQLG